MKASFYCDRSGFESIPDPKVKVRVSELKAKDKRIAELEALSLPVGFWKRLWLLLDRDWKNDRDEDEAIVIQLEIEPILKAHSDERFQDYETSSEAEDRLLLRIAELEADMDEAKGLISAYQKGAEKATRTINRLQAEQMDTDALEDIVEYGRGCLQKHTTREAQAILDLRRNNRKEETGE